MPTTTRSPLYRRCRAFGFSEALLTTLDSRRLALLCEGMKSVLPRRFAEVRTHCDHGTNQGKPGPCPGEGASPKEHAQHIHENIAHPNLTAQHIRTLTDRLNTLPRKQLTDIAQAVNVLVDPKDTAKDIAGNIRIQLVVRKGRADKARAAAAPAAGGANQKEIASQIHGLNQRDPRTGLTPLIPEIFKKLKAEHPGLTQEEFHKTLQHMAASDQLTMQAWGGGDANQMASQTGYPVEAFPDHPRSGKAAWISTRPAATSATLPTSDAVAADVNHLDGIDLEDHATAAGYRNFDTYAHATFGMDKVPRKDVPDVSEYREKTGNIVSRKLRAGLPLTLDEQRQFATVDRLANASKLPVAAVAYRAVGAGFPDVNPGDVVSDVAPAFVGFRQSDIRNIDVGPGRKILAIQADADSRMLYVNGPEPYLESILPAGAKLEVMSVAGDTITARYRAIPSGPDVTAHKHAEKPSGCSCPDASYPCSCHHRAPERLRAAKLRHASATAAHARKPTVQTAHRLSAAQAYLQARTLAMGGGVSAALPGSEIQAPGFADALEFCGGKGSKRPGPCPEGKEKQHVVARAHATAARTDADAHAARLKAAEGRLASAQAAHAKGGNAKTAARLIAAQAFHAEKTRIHQAAQKNAAGHEATAGALEKSKEKSPSAIDDRPKISEDTPVVATKPQAQEKKVDAPKIDTIHASNGLEFTVKTSPVPQPNPFGQTHHVQLLKKVPGKAEGTPVYGKYYSSPEAAAADHAAQVQKVNEAAAKSGIATGSQPAAKPEPAATSPTPAAAKSAQPVEKPAPGKVLRRAAVQTIMKHAPQSGNPAIDSSRAMQVVKELGNIGGLNPAEVDREVRRKWGARVADAVKQELSALIGQ